ncbi:hypothetical protein GW17_00046306 [Ensete ventricosum]|nr:hypothetical protein GW17_00046306 [Ensete ventricosum]
MRRPSSSPTPSHISLSSLSPCTTPHTATATRCAGHTGHIPRCSSTQFVFFHEFAMLSVDVGELRVWISLQQVIEWPHQWAETFAMTLRVFGLLHGEGSNAVAVTPTPTPQRPSTRYGRGFNPEFMM